MKLNYDKIEDIELDDIDTKDYPKFCDAFVTSATYNGREMSEDELDELNEDADFIHEEVYKHLY